MPREIYVTIPAVCTDPDCETHDTGDGLTWAKDNPTGHGGVCVKCGAEARDSETLAPFRSRDFLYSP